MKRFKYTLHNIIGHPVMELLHLVGFTTWSERVHDATLPKGWEEDDEPSPKWDAGEPK